MSSKLLRSLISVASGTLAGQVVVLAFSPIITRIYGPEVFGLQGLFLSMISILGPITALRFPMAIVIAQTQKEADQILSLGLTVALATMVVMEAALLVAFQADVLLLSMEKLGGLVFLLPLALFLTSIQETIDIRTARLGRFRLIAKVIALQALIANLARVLGGWGLAPTASVLVFTTTLAPAIQGIMLEAGNKEHRARLAWLSWVEVKNLIVKYRDFPLYRAPTDMIGAMSQSIPVLMLASIFSPSTAGFYVLARSVINLPLNVIGGAVGNVYYSRFAEIDRNGERLFPAVWKSTAAHFFLFGLPILIISPIFPKAFAIVFGSEWQISGEFAQWMALWIAGMLINIPSVRVLPVIGKQHLHLIANIVLSIGGAVAMLASQTVHGTPHDAVFWFSVVIAVIYVFQIATYSLVIFRRDLKLRNV